MYTTDGRRLKTIHRKAVPHPQSLLMGNTHTLTASETQSVDSTEYIGDFVFENNAFKQYHFEGGYITASSTKYYIKDHLGNNRILASYNGTVEQTTHYYPFGATHHLSTNQDVQKYKYNGKELDTMHGLNWYDYGARQYDPAIAQFTTVDPLCEKYYHISPYAYCGGNPVNAIDLDGKLTIFINGFCPNPFDIASQSYWGKFASNLLEYFHDDSTPHYIDGSCSSWLGWLAFPAFNDLNAMSNLSSSFRDRAGYVEGLKDVTNIIASLAKDDNGTIIEPLHIVTHSMGGAFGKGYVRAIMEYVNANLNKCNGFRIAEYDFAPFQPSSQNAVYGVDTYQYSHHDDLVAGANKIKGASYHDSYYVWGRTKTIPAHDISSFLNEISNLPEGRYIVENGKIIKK